MKSISFGMFLLVSAVAGCTVPETFEGSVTQITDRTVTVRGTFAMDGSTARPTAAMVAQAKAICPTARYVSATAVVGDVNFFDYLFQCN